MISDEVAVAVEGYESININTGFDVIISRRQHQT